jgi:hypothetical protein
MGAGQLHPGAGTGKVRDRPAVETLGGIALAHEGADAGLNTQRPVGGRHPRAFGQPVECGPDECCMTGPGRRLGQLGHDKGPKPSMIASEDLPSGVARGVVATEAVIEHRARVGRKADHLPQTVCGCLLHGCLDQSRRLRLLTPPGRKCYLGIRNRWILGRLSDQAIFFDQQRRGRQFAGE